MKGLIEKNENRIPAKVKAEFNAAERILKGMKSKEEKTDVLLSIVQALKAIKDGFKIMGGEYREAAFHIARAGDTVMDDKGKFK